MEGPSPAGQRNAEPDYSRGSSDHRQGSTAKKSAPAPAQSAPKRDEPVDPPNVPVDTRPASTVNPSPSSSGGEAPQLDSNQENVPGDRRQESTVNQSPPSSEGAWQKIRSAAVTIKRPLGTYLDNCQLAAFDGKEMRLSFPDPYTMGLVEKEENFEALQEAVAEVCGKPDIKIKLQLATSAPAPSASETDPVAPETPKGKGSSKKGSSSEEEVLKDALDVFGGIVIR